MSNQTHGNIIEDYDDTRDDDCWNCGGDGFVADCFDGFCINAEDGCSLCMRRCDFCNPPKDRRATLAKVEQHG